MSAVVLSVVALAGLVVTSWLTLRAWDSRRAPALIVDPELSWPRRVVLVLQRASGLVAAGVVTGVLVLGLGTRLMMRILAATSPDSAQGRITDAEEIVGEVTLGGTVGFAVFIGLFGALFAVGVWLALRRWLPDRSWMAGVVLAGLGAGLLARPSGLIDPDNADFVILSPVWLAVFLSALVLLLYGVSFAVLADRWATHWPRLGSPRGIVAAVPLAAVFGLSLMVIVPAVIIAVVVCWVAWRRPRSERTQELLARSERPGSWILGGVAALGTTWVGISAVQILML